jgi:hypothetical protein
MQRASEWVSEWVREWVSECVCMCVCVVCRQGLYNLVTVLSETLYCTYTIHLLLELTTIIVAVWILESSRLTIYNFHCCPCWSNLQGFYRNTTPKYTTHKSSGPPLYLWCLFKLLWMHYRLLCYELFGRSTHDTAWPHWSCWHRIQVALIMTSTKTAIICEKIMKFWLAQLTQQICLETSG